MPEDLESREIFLSIVRTLAYSSVFDYPLLGEEIFKYLISQKKYPREEVLGAIEKLKEAHVVCLSNDYYYLPGRKDIVEKRVRRRRSSEIKWKRANRIAGLLKVIPWITLIGVSGALSMDNSDEDDDIDLVIFTPDRRLWITRGIVVLLLIVLGFYRRPNRIVNRICPNLFVSDSGFGLFEENLFIAHEIVQLRVILDRTGAYSRFIDRNAWVSKFMPNVETTLPVSSGLARARSLFTLTIDKIELLAMDFQIRFMSRKKTREVTAANIMRFHPRDTTSLVLEKYRSILDEIK